MTTTATVHELIMLDHDQLQPHPDNPRKRFVDIAELAKSIAGVGILEPLLVLPPNDDGIHLIVAGERRWRASAKANLDGPLPCVVRTMTPVEVLEAMLTENLQRSELTPIEEARAYQGLIDLDATVASIAKKVGRSQPLVKSRLALLALPPKVLALVETGDLTLGTADELLAYAADDDAMAWFAKALADGEILFKPAGQVGSYIARRDRDREVEAMRTQLADKGLTEYVPNDSYWSPPYELTTRGPCKLTQLGFTAAAHAKEPCHAVWLEGTRYVHHKLTKVPLCLKPGRHTPTAKPADRSDLQLDDAKAKSLKKAKAPGVSAEEKARQKHEQQLKEIRTEFVAKLLAGPGKVPFELPPIVDTILLARPSYEVIKVAVAMVGIDVAKLKDTGGVNPEWNAWFDFCDIPRNRARAVAAVVLAQAEHSFAYEPSSFDGITDPDYLELLVAHGYQLSSLEEKVLVDAERLDPPEPAPAPAPTDAQVELAELTALSADMNDGPELDQVNARIAELMGTPTADDEEG
jgi:ParB/RepB/Spo0J family partition protein